MSTRYWPVVGPRGTGGGTGMRDTSWHDRADCRGREDLFFAPEDEPGADKAYRVGAAKMVCGGCKVRLRCLGDALEHNEPGGIWGGLTADERRAYAKAVRRRERERGAA